MEQRYLALRTHLEELGYSQPLYVDSLPLVEKLVGDLIQTTESLQKYMKLSQDMVTERDSLLLGAEPYRCDNAKLVKECNELHLAFLQYREQNEKLQKDLRKRLYELEREATDRDKENEALRSQVKVLEVEGAVKSTRQIRSNTTKTGIKPLKSSSTSALLKNKGTAAESNTAMSLADNKITNLSKEISRLKEDKLELAQANIAYKNQINNRDKEIQRLTQMLHGGRPVEAVNQDCCYKDIEVKLVKLQDETLNLRRTNSDLENQLKDAIAKQHEAMKRALMLAERNKILEKELKDIDQMALAVEHECNSTVKTNTEKVNRLQNRLHEAILQIQQLEKDALDLKRDKQELLSDLEAVKTEKRHLQGLLEATLEEKKRASSRVNQYGIIENDLNLEIDRLVQLSAEQKRKIAELECKILSGKLDKAALKTIDELQPSGTKGKRTTPPLRSKAKSPIGRKHKMTSGGDNPTVGVKVPDNTPVMISPMAGKKGVEDAATSPVATLCPQPDQCIKRIEDLITRQMQEKNVCFDRLKEAIGQEVNELHTKATTSLEQFKEERDFYKKECDELMDKLKALWDKTDNPCLQQKLKQKEQELSKLQHDLRALTQEKQNLLIRIDSARSQQDDYDALSFRSSTKRMERERDLLRADIQRLEEERDGLRHRINVLCENYNQEKVRLETMLRDREHEVRQLEQDRREFMHNQGTRRATINNLQEECDMLSTQLKSCQSELTQQRATYSQLKMLHEQTDRALADCQSQLVQAEKEMYALREKLKASETQKEDCHKETLNLKNDLLVMKNNLMTFDREKDSLLHTLDEKTEKLVLLEQELKTKDKKIEGLEANISDLRKRISENLTERSSKEHLLRSATADSQKLQQELDAAIRARELAYEENRRLQNDLTSCTRDNKKIQTDLDIARRQVDDLKRQLQHYVAEIKRAEDLISQKEVERSEMLDHYKSLSEEATNLESTNHTLENEATQARVQLSVALDHAADVERKVEAQDTMIRDYEKQISNLTAQIARLETRIEETASDKQRIETELLSMRDLCLKLDKQKDNLIKQLNDRESSKAEIAKDNTNLRRNSQTLQSELEKERCTVECLERHLAQCRQDSVEMRLLNEELRADVQKLKVTIQELQNKLKLCLCASMQTENLVDTETPAERNMPCGRPHPAENRISSIFQKYVGSKPAAEQILDKNSKSQSTKLMEVSSEQGVANKSYHMPSSSTKTFSRALHRKPVTNNDNVHSTRSAIPTITVVIAEEFDGNTSKDTDHLLVAKVQDTQKPAKILKQTQDKFLSDQPEVPNVDSISQSNISVDFDERLSKSVKYPSDINIASYHNAPESKNSNKASISNQDRSLDQSKTATTSIPRSNIDTEYVASHYNAPNSRKSSILSKRNQGRAVTEQLKIPAADSVSGYSIADDTSPSKSSKQSQNKFVTNQSKTPEADSISRSNIDAEFDEQLSKTVKYLSDVNVASYRNIADDKGPSKPPKQNQTKFTTNQSKISEADSISRSNIDAEFDEQLSKSVKYLSDVNVASNRNIADDKGPSKPPKQNQSKFITIQSKIPEVDSISQSNIDLEFDEHLSLSVKNPSDINIASHHNAPGNNKPNKTSKLDRNKRPTSFASNARRIYENLTALGLSVNIDNQENLPSVQEKAKSKIPVLEKRARSNHKDSEEYQNVTCTYSSPTSSNDNVVYTFSYKSRPQDDKETK